MPFFCNNKSQAKTAALVFFAIYLMSALSNNSSAASIPDTLYLSFGVGLNQYSGQVERIIDRYEENKTYGRAAVHINLPGIYWTQEDRHWLIGGSVSSDFDSFSVEHADFYFLKFHTSASVLYFASSAHHQGLYFRGDIGLLREMVAGDPLFKPEFHWGLTSLGAIAYALPISGEITINLQLHYMPQLNQSRYESNTGFSIGVMF